MIFFTQAETVFFVVFFIEVAVDRFFTAAPARRVRLREGCVSAIKVAVMWEILAVRTFSGLRIGTYSFFYP